MFEEYNENIIEEEDFYSPVQVLPQTYFEKQEIKRIALRISISMLLLFAVSSLFGVGYSLVAKLLGLSTEEILFILRNPATLQVLQIALSLIMFTLPFIIVAKLAGYNVSKLAPFEKPKSKNNTAFFFLGVGFCAFANIAVTFAANLFEGLGMDYSVDHGENPEGFFGFLLVVLSTVLVPALVEEFSCRGIMFGMLEKYGQAFAIIVSSAIFGLIHGNFEQMPFAFLVGLVLGLIRVKTGSLWICCLVHAFNNFISVLFDYAFNGFSISAQNTIYTFILIASLIAGILSVVFSADKKDFFNIQKAEHSCTIAQKYIWFFTSPATIILILIYLIQATTYFF